MSGVRILNYVQQVEVADLWLSGMSQIDIANRFGVSRLTLNRLFKSPDFKQLLSDRETAMRKSAPTTTIDKDKERGIENLKQYWNRRRQTAIASQVFGISALQRLKQQFDAMDLSKLSPKDLAALVRAFSSLAQNGSNAEADSLDLEKLIAYFQSEQSKDSD